MLATLGFAMIAVFVILLMTRRLSALAALIVVPAVFAVAGGFGADLGDLAIEGLSTVAPTGVMLIFAMIYFMVVTDAGMFDPLARAIVRAVGGDPVRILVGTVALGILVALDGDGATVYMIVLSAMLPLYRRIGLSLPLVACLLLQCTGLGNILPWGGPTSRAAVAMGVDVNSLFVSMILPILAAVGWTVLLAILFGLRERRRIGVAAIEPGPPPAASSAAAGLRLIINWLLTGGLIAALVAGVLPTPLLFMIAAVLAMIINFPAPGAQAERLAAHAPAILAVAALIFAAGVFTGVLSGSGMAKAMAASVVAVIPPQVGPYMAAITALISIPVTWVVSNDVFYFGMLPVLAEAASHYGITPMEMARASLIGQPVHMLSPLVASTYLLVGLLDLDYAANQKFVLKYSAVSCLVMLAAAMLTGAIPLYRSL